MKDWLSYIAPFCGLAILYACSFCFAVVNFYNIREPQKENAIYYNIGVLSLYGLLVIMATVSLLTAWCVNPGQVPKNYSYK